MKRLQVDQMHEGAVYNRDTEKHTATYRYKVIKVTNSLTPSIAESLSPEELAYYCDSEEWDVTIK